jgi:hypothetical protein
MSTGDHRAPDHGEPEPNLKLAALIVLAVMGAAAVWYWLRYMN